jgi:hypothetical protein
MIKTIAVPVATHARPARSAPKGPAQAGFGPRQPRRLRLPVLELGPGAAHWARSGVKVAAWTPSHTRTTIKIAGAAATVAPFHPRAVPAASAAVRQATPAAWGSASAASPSLAIPTTAAAVATLAPSDKAVSVGLAREPPPARPAISLATERRLGCVGTGALAGPGRAKLGKVKSRALLGCRKGQDQPASAEIRPAYYCHNLRMPLCSLRSASCAVCPLFTNSRQ